MNTKKRLGTIKKKLTRINRNITRNRFVRAVNTIKVNKLIRFTKWDLILVLIGVFYWLFYIFKFKHKLSLTLLILVIIFLINCIVAFINYKITKNIKVHSAIVVSLLCIPFFLSMVMGINLNTENKKTDNIVRQNLLMEKTSQTRDVPIRFFKISVDAPQNKIAAVVLSLNKSAYCYTRIVAIEGHTTFIQIYRSDWFYNSAAPPIFETEEGIYKRTSLKNDRVFTEYYIRKDKPWLNGGYRGFETFGDIDEARIIPLIIFKNGVDPKSVDVKIKIRIQDTYSFYEIEPPLVGPEFEKEKQKALFGCVTFFIEEMFKLEFPEGFVESKVKERIKNIYAHTGNTLAFNSMKMKKNLAVDVPDYRIIQMNIDEAKMLAEVGPNIPTSAEYILLYDTNVIQKPR